MNPEPGTRNPEPGTRNPEPGTRNLKDALLGEIRKSSPVMYNALIVQAQAMEVIDNRVVLRYSASQKIGPTFEKYKPTIEATATKLAGRKITAVAETTGGGGAGDVDPAAAAASQRKSAVRDEALADSGVQALLEVFPAEIRDVDGR